MIKYELNLIGSLLQRGRESIFQYGVVRDDFSNETIKKVYDLLLDNVDDLTMITADEELYYEYAELRKKYHKPMYDMHAPVNIILENLKKEKKIEHFKLLSEKLKNSNKDDFDSVLSEFVKDSTMYDSGEKKKTDIKSIVKSSYEQRSKRIKGQLIGYKTGIDKLNNLIDGVCKGRLYIIGGYTSYGKSMLAIHATAHMMNDGASVLFFSLEMSQEQVANRLLSNIGQTNISNFIYSNSGDEYSEQTYNVLSKMKLEIFDSIRDFNKIINIIKSRKSQGKCDVVIIDYIQNISIQGYKDKYAMLSDVSHQLQTIAIQEDVAIIALSQVNRESVKTKSNAHGFKGAGDIEEAGGVAILIQRFKDENKNELTLDYDIVVSKNRHGRTGVVNCYIKPEQSSIYQI